MIRLFHHQWLSALRSSYWQKSVAANLLLGVIGIYLLLNFAVIGWFADELILKIYGVSDTISLFSGLLLFYFLSDFLARFMMQKTELLDLQPYLIFPISKRKLVHYSLLKTFFSFFNLLALCLLVPYFIKVIVPSASLGFSLGWLTTVLSLVLVNNFLVFVLRRQYVQQPLILIVVMVVVGLLLFINHSGLIALTDYFSGLLLFIAAQPLWFAFPLILLALSYYIAYHSVWNGMYLETVQATGAKRYGELSFLSKRGQVAGLAALELKMLWRNKKSRSSIFLGLFYIVYGILLCLRNPDDFMSFMFSILMIASFAMMYGQFFFSWESSYFGFYLSNNLSFTAYLKAKYLVYILLLLIAYVLVLPLALWRTELFIIHTAFVLYTSGVGAISMLLLGCFKEKRISLERSQMMNYEGASIVEFLMVLPIVGLPLILYFGLGYFGQANYVTYTIGALGGLGLMLHPLLLQMAVRLFEKRRYKMAQGFRN